MRSIFHLFMTATTTYPFHHSRAKLYGDVLQARYSWVLHFTTMVENEAFQYPYPTPSIGVHVIHVLHNYEFDDVRIQYLKDNGEKVMEKVV